MSEQPISFPPPGFSPVVSHVVGIEVYLPTDTVQALPDVADFACPRCGANSHYDVTRGGLACPYCGYNETPQEKAVGRGAQAFEFRVETISLDQQRAASGWGEQRKEMACQRCGGSVSITQGTLAYHCPFCGSNKVLVREPVEDVLRPHFLIPFQVTPQDCQTRTQAWFGSSWMIPKDLRSLSTEKFNPLYVPYWTFSAVCHARWKAQVAHETVERHFVNGEMREYRKTEWRNEGGSVEKPFEQLLVPGTTHLKMATLAHVDHFDVNALIAYAPAYLAGMQAQACDTPLEKAWEAGRQVMREQTRQACLDRASSSNLRSFTMSMDFEQEAWRYILVPVYTSIYHYQDKTFQILLNGQTGQISGPRPVDWEKVWLAAGILLIPGLLLTFIGWLFVVQQDGGLTAGFGLFLALVGAVIAFFLILQAQRIEHD